MQQFESRCICMSGLKRQNELHRHGEVVKIVPVAADGEVHFARPLKWIIVYQAVPQFRTNPKRDAPSRRVSFEKAGNFDHSTCVFFFLHGLREKQARSPACLHLGSKTKSCLRAQSKRALQQAAQPSFMAKQAANPSIHSPSMEADLERRASNS